MAILVSVSVKGQTIEGYNGVLQIVKDSVRNYPGFIFHGAYPSDGEWIVTEIWESKKQADECFVKNVVPHLPPGIHPKRQYFELHSAVLPGILSKGANN